MNRKKSSGFSLLELMVAIAIVAILGAIGYPAYTDHVTRARRAQAETALMNMAARMETYYARNNSYVGATPATIGAPTVSENGDYNLGVTAATATTYTLQATPVGTQAVQDAGCGSLQLNQLGQRLVTGTTAAGECWR